MDCKLTVTSVFSLTLRVHLFLYSTTADGLSEVNMTNLAIKGIIAIRSMAEISRAVEESDDYNNYSVRVHFTFP